MLKAATSVVVAAVALAIPVGAGAQTPAGAPGSGGWFVGGSLLGWRVVSAPPITPTNPLLRDTVEITGSPLTRSVAGVSFQTGIDLRPRLFVGAEYSLRMDRSTTVLDIQPSHTTITRISSRYSDADRLLTILAGTPLTNRSSRVGVQLSAGLTIWTFRHRRSDRSLVTFYPGGVFESTPPDTATSLTRIGVGGGADVVIRLRGSLAATSMVRVHLRRGGDTQPPSSGSAILVGAGLRWQSGR